MSHPFAFTKKDGSMEIMAKGEVALVAGGQSLTPPPQPVLTPPSDPLVPLVYKEPVYTTLAMYEEGGTPELLAF